MDTSSAPAREVAIPASALSSLRTALRLEVDGLKVTHSFHTAGFSAGADVFAVLAGRLSGAAPAEMADRAFWDALSSFFQRSGWGTLTYRDLHPGVGVLETSNWAEVGDTQGPDEPGCAFSSGLLAAVLGQVAGGPVAVLEISCRSRGDDLCRFAFGSEATIHDLYGLLLDGNSLDEALNLL
jgi:hypothetical protein